MAVAQTSLAQLLKPSSKEKSKEGRRDDDEDPDSDDIDDDSDNDDIDDDDDDDDDEDEDVDNDDDSSDEVSDELDADGDTSEEEAFALKKKKKAFESIGGQTQGRFHFTARVREAETLPGGGGKAVCVMLMEGPGNPSDRHFYSTDAINEAAASGVFEGAQAYLDHPTTVEDQIRPERSLRDLIGYWTDVHTEAVRENGQNRLALIGTFIVEKGATFVLNKLQEGLAYNRKYPNRSYFGFSINATGLSHPEDIDGVEYNIVDKITEAVSTDMVTRAGAGGKLLTLKEALRMPVTKKATSKSKSGLSGLDPKSAKVLESAISSILDKKLKALREKGNPALDAMGIKEKKKPVEEAEVEEAEDGMEEAGPDNLVHHKTTTEKTYTGADDDEDEDADDEDEPEEDEESDPTHETPGHVEQDEDGEDDSSDEDVAVKDQAEDEVDESMDKSEDSKVHELESKAKAKEKEAKMKPTVESYRALAQAQTRLAEARAAQLRKYQMRESVREVGKRADRIIEKYKVPASARLYVKTELTESCKTSKQMGAKCRMLLETIIKPLQGLRESDRVTGVVASGRSMRERNTGLINLTEV